MTGIGIIVSQSISPVVFGNPVGEARRRRFSAGLARGSLG